MAVERQGRILALRGELQQCGQCARRPEIQAELDRYENADKTMQSVIGDIGMRYGVDLSALARLNDPLGLRAGQSRREKLQSDLIQSYCYATTGNSEAYTTYRLITPKDLSDSDSLVGDICSASTDKFACAQQYSLNLKMRLAIARGCSMDLAAIPAEYALLVERCNHTTRPKMAELQQTNDGPLEVNEEVFMMISAA